MREELLSQADTPRACIVKIYYPLLKTSAGIFRIDYDAHSLSLSLMFGVSLFASRSSMSEWIIRSDMQRKCTLDRLPLDHRLLVATIIVEGLYHTTLSRLKDLFLIYNAQATTKIIPHIIKPGKITRFFVPKLRHFVFAKLQTGGRHQVQSRKKTVIIPQRAI